MTGKTGKTSKFAAILLFSVNIIVMVFCAILFGFALWLISSPRTLASSIQGFGTPTIIALLSPPHLTLTLGLSVAAMATFLFFVAFMGFYGALVRSPFLLFMYAMLVLLLLLLECALLFYFTSSLTEKGLLIHDGQWTHALRLAFKCCEHNSTTIQHHTKLPWSCCGPGIHHNNNCSTSEAFTKNCNHVIPTWLQRYQTAIYASLSVLHILLASCALLRRVRNSDYHS